MKNALVLTLVVAVLGTAQAAPAAKPPGVDERPGGFGEWGFRPGEGAASEVNPPRFSWRPQKNAASYEVQASRGDWLARVEYEARGIRYNVHCPPRTFPPGRWSWRFRFVDGKGTASAWSKIRSFTLAKGAAELPLPGRKELLARVPKRHPRLFVRPEQLPGLRKLARGELRSIYDGLVQSSERLLKRPPPTAEPPKYPKGTTRLSEEWRKIWWGNRTYTVRVLNGAATLAFTHLLGGKKEYAQLARRLLMDAAKWDPKGATGYRYNDEAGMPYAYYFSRAYTFVNPLLTDADRAKCRQVMQVRGAEMYNHLSRYHLWRPYGSHRNRAWHFLGEVAVAFHGEIPEADEWLWFAMNVFANVYPVWSDDDGGWHEGAAYWRSYVGRFTWWADVMRAAVKIDAYRLPYFSKVGYYPMYLQPPGTVGGGFGDLTARLRSSHNTSLMTILAAQAQNPYWQWYVEAHGGPVKQGGYIGFVRGALPKVTAKPPTDLPASRCFRGTGQAMLHTNLMDAGKNVQILFKSSPFGTQSHGYEAQNAFLLYAFGQRLLIRTGRRDIYGSKHHKDWMWHTKSVNSITVDGQSQFKRSVRAVGEIIDFHTSKHVDYVAGEAGKAYGDRMKRFTRSLLFAKPNVVVIFDRLEAAEPGRFQWHLHAPTKMALIQRRGRVYGARVANGRAACTVSFLAPAGLKISQTDKFDPPPRPRVRLVEYHLTAETPQPSKTACFVTLLRVHPAAAFAPGSLSYKAVEGGYVLRVGLLNGHEAVVLLRLRGDAVLSAEGFTTNADVGAIILGPDGKRIEAFRAK